MYPREKKENGQDHDQFFIETLVGVTEGGFGDDLPMFERLVDVDGEGFVPGCYYTRPASSAE